MNFRNLILASLFFISTLSYAAQNCGCCLNYKWGNLPPTYTDECPSWNVELELLYWNACENGLGYALKQKIDTSHPAEDDLNFTVDSSFKNPNYDWCLGYRLGIVYLTDCDGWDVALRGTYFHTNGNSSADCDCPEANDVGNGLFCRLGATSGLIKTLTPENIDADLDVKLSMIDLELGREFCISKCLHARPFIGLRYAYVDHKFEMKYVSCNDTTTLGQYENIVDKIRLDNEYKGIGPRIGATTDWEMGCNLAIYGTVAASILYGDYDIDFSEKFDNKEANPQSGFIRGFTYKLQDEFYSCLAVTDLALGLRWSKPFEDYCVCYLGLGWEEHIFFNVNQYRNASFNPDLISIFQDLNPPGPLGFFHPNMQSNRGDLNIGGLVFTARLDF